MKSGGANVLTNEKVTGFFQLVFTIFSKYAHKLLLTFFGYNVKLLVTKEGKRGFLPLKSL
jgi:hypothetical protein